MGKVAMVTGANAGMGLATTIALAKEGMTVIMLCRNKERGEHALKEAKEVSGSTAIELMLCDLGSMDEIRQFAHLFISKFEQLDVLVNNAGIFSLKRELTSDGFERMLGVNHLGHFLLTYLLLDPLKRAPQGRVINVSSNAHKWGTMDFDDPYFQKRFNAVKGYGRSKLANILFTRGLADRLTNTAVTVNSLHPGAVATNIGVNRDTGFGKRVIKLLVPFFKTPEEGARTAAYLAVSPQISEVSGLYFYKEKEASISKLANDDELVECFWEWSEREVGIKSGISN